MINPPIACNLELTTCCPLRCPQCYCSLTGGKHLDKGVAIRRIEEASTLGVRLMHLSGGETMCYPFLYDVLSEGKKRGIEMDIATSGYNFDKTTLHRLVNAGVGNIYISLNGSTEAINSLTRDGYDYAIDALRLLDSERFEHSRINWVMHSNNTDDFPNVMEIAEKYHVQQVVVLSFKPDSHSMLLSYPSGEQIRKIAKVISNYRGNVKIAVESCFSPLLAVIRDTAFLGNTNRGMYKGCGAGRFSYSVNVDGVFSPCRHMDYFEFFNTTYEYWTESVILDRLRHVEEDTREPCNQCKYREYCRHCLAINAVMQQSLYIGLEVCDLWKS